MNKRYHIPHGGHVYEFVVDDALRIIRIDAYFHMSQRARDLSVNEVPADAIKKLRTKLNLANDKEHISN